MTEKHTTLVIGREVLCGIGSDGTAETIKNGAVLVEAGRITAIGSSEELLSAHPSADVLGSASDVIAPGFINAHHHVGLTPFQLGATDLPLELWFAATMGTRSRDPYLDTLYSAFELISSGVTTVQHLHIGRGSPSATADQAEGILRAYRDIGMRVSYSYAYRDQNRLVYENDDTFLARLPPGLAAEMSPWFADQHFPLEDYLDFVEGMADRFASDDSVSIQLAPANLHWCSDKALEGIGELSRRRHLPMHMHLLETAYQARYGIARSPDGAVAHLEQLGLLGPLLTLGHGVWLRESDIDRLAASGTCLCHNAGSNMRLGSGRAPCRHLLGRGIKVAIGIDEAGLNDDRDMLQEMRLVSHLHKDPGVLDKRLGAGDVFRMATEHGAQTTGFAGTIGRIAPGMAADLVLFDWNTITGPYLDAEVPLVDAIVYRAKQRAVRTVMIGGRVVYADGAFTFVDRESALREIHLAMSGPPSETELRRRRTGRELMSHLRTFYTTGEWGELSSRLVRNAEAMTFYQPELD